MLIVGTGPRLAEMREACIGQDCDDLLLAPEEEELLRQRGQTTRFYALYMVGLEQFLAVLFIAIAVVIYWRRSDTWIGLAVSLFLVSFGTNVIAESDAALARLYPALRAPVRFMNALAFSVFLLVPYLFPDGRFVPRWTRWLSVILAVLTLGALFSPAFDPISEEGFSVLLGIVVFAYMIGGILAQVYRYRRISDPVQRQQTKWIIFGFAGITIMTLAFIWVFFLIDPPPGRFRLDFKLLGYAAFTLLSIPLPISFAVSILRYRLWDIDFIVSRALIYGLLTGTLTGVWALSTRLISGIAERALGATAAATASLISTIVIVSIFQPVRTAIEGWVSERFVTSSPELAGGLNEFSSWFLARLDLPDLLDIILDRICALMGNVSGAIYLDDGSGAFRVARTFGIDAADLTSLNLPEEMHGRWGRARAVVQPEGGRFGVLAPLHVAVLGKEEMLGILALGPRAGGRGYSRDERRGLADFGAQAGRAIYRLQFADQREALRQQRGRDSS